MHPFKPQRTPSRAFVIFSFCTPDLDVSPPTLLPTIPPPSPSMYIDTHTHTSTKLVSFFYDHSVFIRFQLCLLSFFLFSYTFGMSLFASVECLYGGVCLHPKVHCWLLWLLPSLPSFPLPTSHPKPFYELSFNLIAIFLSVFGHVLNFLFFTWFDWLFFPFGFRCVCVLVHFCDLFDLGTIGYSAVHFIAYSFVIRPFPPLHPLFSFPFSSNAQIAIPSHWLLFVAISSCLFWAPFPFRHPFSSIQTLVFFYPKSRLICLHSLIALPLSLPSEHFFLSLHHHTINSMIIVFFFACSSVVIYDFTVHSTWIQVIGTSKFLSGPVFSFSIAFPASCTVARSAWLSHTNPWLWTARSMPFPPALDLHCASFRYLHLQPLIIVIASPFLWFFLFQNCKSVFLLLLFFFLNGRLSFICLSICSFFVVILLIISLLAHLLTQLPLSLSLVCFLSTHLSYLTNSIIFY